LGLLLLVGCSDHPGRASGEALRDATTQARQLYTQAHAILSDPSRTGQDASSDAVPADALDLLDRAEAELGKALAKSASDNGENMDQMLARQLLSMIRYLRGQCSYWTMQQHSRSMQEQLSLGRTSIQHLIVVEARQRSAQAKAQPNKHEEEIRKKASADKTEATTQLATIDGKLKSLDDRIAEMESQGNTKTTKAIELRAQSRLRASSAMEGNEEAQKRLGLLDQALAVEREVHQLQWELRQARQDKANLQDQRQQVQLTLDGAQAKLDAFAQSDATDSQAVRARLQSERQKWATQLQQSLAELARLSATMLQQSMQAETAYDKSAQAARESLALAPPTEKLTCMLLQAEARTGMGNSHLLLWQVRSQIGLLKDDLAGLSQKAASQNIPTFPNDLATYQGETATSAENAVTYYTDAADLYSKAVTQSPRNQRWRLQRGLAWAYIQQAQAYGVQGKGSQQQQAMQKAKDLLSNILQGAEAAGEKGAATTLQQVIEATP
jgi:hypothetical protein